MRAYGAPGVALAVTDRQQTIVTRFYGFSEVASRTPVASHHLFQIGSIGKSFTAAAFMQLVEEGRVDLHAPITEYLPWFEVRSAFPPITVHHLLTHTACIIEGSDLSSDSRFDVWALRDTDVGAPPGERYHYSNLGYRVLGFALEEIDGRPYAEIIRERVLIPAGMIATEPVITNAIRERQAVGYDAFPDDRPLRYEAPLAPATWIETGTGDGSIASTAEDMAAYVRVWLNRGRGDRGRVVSEQSFELMTPGAGVETGEGERYGYGLDSWVGEPDLIGHGGRMIGFGSEMRADLDSGHAVVILVNSIDWEDWAVVSREVLAWLRNIGDGTPLDVPTAPDFLGVEDAAAYGGEYRDEDGPLVVSVEEDRLVLEWGGERIRLERRPADRFLVRHPDFELFLLGFEREKDRVVAVHHGGRRWRRAGVAGHSSEADHPVRSNDAYAGHYRSDNPWTTNFRVVDREGELLWVHPRGFEEPLVPLSDGRFRVGAEAWSPERLTFDAIVDGHALRANLSGSYYYRASTP